MSDAEAEVVVDPPSSPDQLEKPVLRTSWIEDSDSNSNSAGSSRDFQSLSEERKAALAAMGRQQSGAGASDDTAPGAAAADSAAAAADLEESTVSLADRIQFEEGKLSCVGLDLETLPEELMQYAAETRQLDLSFNCLQSLEGLAPFTELEELVLDNNEVTDEGMACIPSLPRLRTLTANKNNLTEMEAFVPVLKERAPGLTYLSLLNNTACPNELVQKDEEDYQRYRYALLQHLASLKFLDSRPVTAAEVAEAKRVGGFAKVVRYDPEKDERQKKSKKKKKKPSEETQFSPLPQESRPPESHRSSIGQCKYVYYGRHSEGNRFIRNSDL